jgi:predicted hydrolase (HD superfamily)
LLPASGRGEHPIATGRFWGYPILKDDTKEGTVLGALKKFFARHVAKEAPLALNVYAPDPSTLAALTTALPPPHVQNEPAEVDAIINRFEPLLVHCPKNIKVLETLAEA